MPPPARRFPIWPYAIALVIILVFALWPMASVAISGFIAETNGCVLNEGSIHPCVVDGTDIGPSLYTGFVLGWFMLATIPIGAVAFVVWLGVLLVHIGLRYSRRNRIPR
jgi:hypothetical protein